MSKRIPVTGMLAAILLSDLGAMGAEPARLRKRDPEPEVPEVPVEVERQRTKDWLSRQPQSKRAKRRARGKK